MRKKHFEALAAGFWALLIRPNTPAERAAIIEAIEVVIRVATDANPRFDEPRFRAACGLPE
jgi:hypothetical protein